MTKKIMILLGKFKEEKILPWKNGKGQDRVFIIEEDSGWLQSIVMSPDFKTPKVDEEVSYNVGLKPYFFKDKKLVSAYLKVWAVKPKHK